MLCANMCTGEDGCSNVVKCDPRGEPARARDTVPSSVDSVSLNQL